MAALRATELAHVFQFPRATMPHPVTWSRVLGTAVNVDVLQHLIRQVLQPDDAVVPARASIALALDGKTIPLKIPLLAYGGTPNLWAYQNKPGARVGLCLRASTSCVVSPRLCAHVVLLSVTCT